MKQAVIIIFFTTILILSACNINNDHANSPRADSPDEETKPFIIEPATVEEAKSAAEEAVRGFFYYAENNGRNLEFLGYQETEDEYVREFSFYFEIDDPEGSEEIKTVNLTISVQGKNPAGIRSVISGKACREDADCFDESFPEDIKAYCIGQVCIKKKIYPEEIRHCISKGGQTDEREDGIYCLFLDGSECEVNAFLEGACQKGAS